MLNISKILPLCCSNKNFITEGSIPGNVIKLPSLNTIKASTTKIILCLNSTDFVKPPSPPVILFPDLDIFPYFFVNSITDLVHAISFKVFFSLIVHGPIIFTF